ncbi:MAG: hypothetical protein RML46_11800 [Anaerolineae bacterium]|nr:hypothetical protein [Anaerolineae bacterium]MDW8069582.1 hypothetical protein [Anaerolineae bacterium]
MTREPLFAGLIYNEEGQPVRVVRVGADFCYAIPDGDFLRHVDAIEVDRQVLAQLKERFLPMRDVLIEGAMRMMGTDDPFTRAALEMGLENMDRMLEPGAVNPEDFRLALWMSGFRIIVNYHGEVVRLEIPGLE